ncbi:unnamed protein product [Sphagnum compactum]
MVGAAIGVEKVLAELGETPYEPLREEQEEEASENNMEKQVDALNNALIYFFKGNARIPACSFSSMVFEECQICRKGDHLATTCPRLNEARLRYAKCNMPHRMESGEVKYTSCAESGYSEDKIWKGRNNGKSRFETANFVKVLLHEEEATQGIDIGRRVVDVITPYEEPRAEPSNTKKEHLAAAEDKVSVEVVDAKKGAQNTDGVLGSAVEGMNEQLKEKLDNVEGLEVKCLTEEDPGILEEEKSPKLGLFLNTPASSEGPLSLRDDVFDISDVGEELVACNMVLEGHLDISEDDRVVIRMMPEISTEPAAMGVSSYSNNVVKGEHQADHGYFGLGSCGKTEVVQKPGENILHKQELDRDEPADEERDEGNAFNAGDDGTEKETVGDDLDSGEHTDEEEDQDAEVAKHKRKATDPDDRDLDQQQEDADLQQDVGMDSKVVKDEEKRNNREQSREDSGDEDLEFNHGFKHEITTKQVDVAEDKICAQDVEATKEMDNIPEEATIQQDQAPSTDDEIDGFHEPADNQIAAELVEAAQEPEKIATLVVEDCNIESKLDAEVEVVESAKEIENVPEPTEGGGAIQIGEASSAVVETNVQIHQVADDQITAEPDGAVRNLKEDTTLPPLWFNYPAAECLPSIGQWNMMYRKLVNGGVVKQWTCINFSRHQVSVKQRTKTCCTDQPTNTRIGQADASNPWMKESCWLYMIQDANGRMWGKSCRDLQIHHDQPD